MQEEVFDAELLPGGGNYRLNLTLAGSFSIAVVFLFLAMGFGDILSDSNDKSQSYEWWETPLQERHKMDLNLTQDRSVLPQSGDYEVLAYTEHFVSVDLPASEEDIGFPEEDVMHVALWLPDVPEGTKVPVIMTIHPYYDFGGEGMPGVGEDSSPNTVPDGGVGAWIYDQFISHGYALAQASTFGTGKSTHCQDVKGLGEQTGIQAVVHWLGEQEWSNGNVGLMGKSYAGTTNWEAAQNPSEHLKTIVPISGSIGVQEMFYRNGSSEARAMGYDAAYQAATSDMTTDELRMCSDDLVGPMNPWLTWAGDEYGGSQWNDYWDERRHLPDVLENYQGSVYLVWGLQDWNVDPYHAFPTYQMMKDAGIHARVIAGQWAHNYPDQPDRHGELGTGYGGEAYPSMSRMDWAIELYNWFEYFLKGKGEMPAAHAQMQTNDGKWHVEETWPPEDVEWREYDVGTWESSGSFTVSATSSALTFTSAFPMEEDIHIQGMPTFHVKVVTGLCNGGQLFVTLRDSTANLRLGHATMDVRYRDGGHDSKITTPLSEYTMLMEFNPMDVRVPAGNNLQLVITETGEDYLPSPCAAIGMNVVGSTSIFSLPLTERGENAKEWFDVPAWWESQDSTD
jgi:hypothetical protein